MNTKHYDSIVIGAGPAGIEAARVLGKNGQKVALIERKAIGGTCVNRGCMPAKTMLYMSTLYRSLWDFAEYGIEIDLKHIKVNYEKMVKQRTRVITSLQTALTNELQQIGVDIYDGEAKVKSDFMVELSKGQKLTATNLVLATGGRARKFPGFDDNDPRFLTSDHIFQLEHLPKSIAIVGGGPVGTEFATFYRAFGVEVTVIDMAPNLIGYYDEKLGHELGLRFEDQGIKLELGTKIDSINQTGKLLEISLDNGKTVEAEYILSAIGVQVDTAYLQETDLTFDEKSGRILVDENYRTNHKHIYAAGDLIGRSGSAYGAEREARYIAYKILGRDIDDCPVIYPQMPDVVFTYPEVATCGYDERTLIAEGRKYKTVHGTFALNSKAHILQETEGRAWIYYAPENGKILGVHVIGAHATEIIHQVPAWLDNHYTLRDVKRLVWGHPVLAELLRDVIAHGNYS